MGIVGRPAAAADAPEWSDTYRGHRIAAMRDDLSWIVVLDNEVQKDRNFECPEEAAAWLRRAVDTRIAERIFPGLAFI